MKFENRILTEECRHKYYKSGPPRDRQRAKAYTAENAAWSNKKLPPFENVEQIANWIREILPTIYGSHGAEKIEVEVIRRRSNCGSISYHTSFNIKTGRPWLIKIALSPPGGFTKSMVIHELAHSLTAPDLEGHGPEWCRNYFELVKCFMGRDFARDLMSAFKAHKVRVAPQGAPGTIEYLG